MPWWKGFFRKNREIELEREIRDHLEIEAEEQKTSGISPDEAKLAALQRFGNPLRVKEDVRETWGLRWLDRLAQDLKYALRTLGKSPAFAVMSVLTLAMSIGATTSIFSQLNTVFWKLLPVEKPGDLRVISWTSPKRALMGANSNTPLDPGTTIERFTYAAYANIRDHATTFSDVACWQDPGENQPLILNSLGRVEGQFVSGNYFRMSGTVPLVGRLITADDDRDGAALVAVLSYRFWQRTFNGDPSAVGQAIQLNGSAFTIIGVMPKGFFGLDPSSVPDVMLPIRPALQTSGVMSIPNQLTNDRYWQACQVVGRLKAEATDERARAEVETLVSQSILTNPPSEAYEMPRIWLTSAAEGTGGLRRTLEQPLLVLMGVVSMILLIACTNIGGLLLARGTSREKEIATRLAIGAPRGRIVRQLVSESLVLAVAGGLLGLVLAHVLNGIIPAFINQFLPSAFGSARDLAVNAGIDSRVLIFALVTALITGLLFGLAPALRTTRVDLLSMLKQSGMNSNSGRRGVWSSGTFVAIQVGLSMLLLTGAGLFIRTVINLRTTPLGYDPSGLLMFRIEPRLSGYTQPRRLEFFESALKHFETIPGIAVASGSVIPVLANVNGQADICISGYTPQDANDLVVGFNSVAPRYFEAMRLPILQGRDVTWADRRGAPLVVLVNEAFAKKYYKDRNPIGERIGCTDVSMRTIVGVVADSRNGPRRDVRPTFYPPYLQQPTNTWMTFVLRTSQDPMTLLPPVREAVNKLDPSVPVLDAITPVDLRDRMMNRERLFMDLLIFFGALGVFLTCLGIYGMLNYMVSRRTSEIGVRMALGASRSDVVRMVVRESLVPVGVGITIGWVAAQGLTRFLDKVLFGVSRNDPWTIAGAVLVLLAIATIAAALPARRASDVDPLIALRQE